MAAYDLLNDQQKRFVDEYLIDLDPTAAAIRAGYSNRSARQIGNENRTKPTIAAAIADKMRERAIRVAASQDRVITELSAIAYADPRLAFDEQGALREVKDWSDSLAAGIKSIKIKQLNDDDGSIVGSTAEINFWDKLKALEMLAKHVGLFESVSSNQASSSDVLKNRIRQARSPDLKLVKANG